MNCAASLNVLEGCFATYHVLEEVVVGDIPKERVLNVVFNQESHDFNCECSLFEFRGILCCHVLSVCAQERIKNVPEKYVLTRWNKNIKRKHSFIKSSYGGTELKPQMVRFEKLCKHFYDIAEVAAKSEDGTKALHETLNQFNSNLPTMDEEGRNKIQAGILLHHSLFFMSWWGVIDSLYSTAIDLSMNACPELY
ncbi:hypothetical protein TSUD_125220 [Trifolium subterraneum]|uniref:Protein FAR1-RELATED SEQUENCE n=1 Tax=Trifolium subterraneum TaxID=3900 RepID=A0A2Z6LLC2_TRISU|nr:hypothetical protein TSUD_125220 [Trifolium subterraneum]